MEATNLDPPKRLNDRPSTVGNDLKSADLSCLLLVFGLRTEYVCDCLDQNSLLAETSEESCVFWTCNSWLDSRFWLEF